MLRDILRERGETMFQIVHHSLQFDHLHLLVEASDAAALARGMASFLIRFAKRLNALIGRKGSLWSGRYHRHDLRTPTEVAHALVYVLHNGKRHGESPAGAGASWLDPYSSAGEFDGWIDIDFAVDIGREPPRDPPRTWLLRVGYRRARVPLATTSAPKPSSAPRVAA